MNRQQRAVGIDLGTFHTVAVHANLDKITFSKRSIPSIAVLIRNATIVGFEAQRQSATATKIIVAPKLKLHDRSESLEVLKPILRGLVSESLTNLGLREASAVLTVPPGWNLSDCIAIKEAVEPLGFSLSFFHEPVALLAAAYHLIRHSSCEHAISGSLINAESVLICDWGAGTVDLAYVRIKRRGDGSIEFSVLGEKTEIGEGGNDLARDIVIETVGDSIKDRADFVAYQLQEAWQGNLLPGFNASLFERKAGERRKQAAIRISKSVSQLLADLSIFDRSKVLFLLYGGPMESADLSDALKAELTNELGIGKSQMINLDSNYVERTGNELGARRDMLVAAGAALYGTSGEAIPEFEYEVLLRDSFGNKTSSVRLVKDKNLKGIQVITPPYTGVDYFVDIIQLSSANGVSTRTAISGELRLHVRSNAVIRYSIAEAGVGFVKIQAAEAMDLPTPELFSDSRIEELLLPEKSTRFILNI
jgi:hypothetical protein